MQPGTYIANPRKATLCLTKNGREQVAVELSDVETGETITAFLFFGDKVDKGGKTLTERTTIALRHCGWSGTKINDLSSINGSAEVEIVVQEEEYEGKVNARVRFINPVGGGGFQPKPMDAEQAKRFAEKMEIDIKRAGATVEPAKPATKRTLPAQEDDTPF
jgi:hypothetical protein